jgi:autotransporter-associated beta strand protein
LKRAKPSSFVPAAGATAAHVGGSLRQGCLIRRGSDGTGYDITYIGRHKPNPLFAVAVAALCVVAQAGADDGYWANPGGGSWASSGNWDSGTIADGTDNTAYFGLSLEPAIPANATFTLDGARTIGTLYFTAATGPDNWALNTGSGGALTLDATFDTPSVTVALASQTITINTVLAGTNGMEKMGPGTLVLTATNIYAGQTIVSQGILRLNGRIGLDGADVLAGALGGTGVISGPLTVESGAILAPGNSIGTLTVSNTLTLKPGSITQIEVNASTLGHDTVQGLTGAIYGGAMTVSNLAGTLAPGQSYQIFNPASASGNFTSITPKPGNYLRWRFLPASGTLSVVSSASQPAISGMVLTGTNLMLQVINGVPGATAYTLTTTNVGLSITNWVRLATNTFDSSGSLAVAAPANPGLGRWFYRIAVAVVP